MSFVFGMVTGVLLCFACFWAFVEGIRYGRDMKDDE